MATMQEILNETTAFVKTKQASFKEKSAIAGENPDTMPGSENDKPAPAGAEAADPEVNDATMGPSDTRTEDGKGDPDKLTGGHATKTEEGAEPVEKKPAVTDEADVEATAKQAEAAKLANDILASIHSFQKKASDTPKEEAKPAEEKEAEKAPEKSEDKSEEKEAGKLDIELTQDVLAKMAAIALSYDEGVDFMRSSLERFSGAKEASETIEFLEQQNLEAEKQAAAAQGYADAERAILEKVYAEGYKAASAANQDADLQKLGQALAEGSISDVMGAIPPVPEAGMVPAEEMAAPMEEAPMEEAPMEEAPMEEGGEDYTVEDLAAALDVLVSSGEIDEATAQEVLEAVVSDQEAPAEEAPVEEAPAEEAPAEEAPTEEAV